MISCSVADKLSANYVASLEQSRADDSRELAKARNVTDSAWGALCEHRATCWRCVAFDDFASLEPWDDSRSGPNSIV